MALHAPVAAVVRRRFVVTGVVQGVGFRPFVHRIATELGLGGFVGNDAAAVFVEVEGDAGAIAEFARRLVSQAPPLARVAGVRGADVDPVGEAAFLIVASEAGSGARTAIPPDVAVCDDGVAAVSVLRGIEQLRALDGEG